MLDRQSTIPQGVVLVYVGEVEFGAAYSRKQNRLDGTRVRLC